MAKSPPRLALARFATASGKSTSTKVVPGWCGLPVPGVSLTMRCGVHTHHSFPIDNRRVYTIGSDGDIVIPEMGDVIVKIFHHRNGSVYVAAVSGVSDLCCGGRSEKLTSEPVELSPDATVVAGAATLEIATRQRATVRDALLHSSTEDLGTRANTEANRRLAKRAVRSPYLATPQSGRRKEKRPCVEQAAPAGRRAVRFLDFADIN